MFIATGFIAFNVSVVIAMAAFGVGYFDIVTTEDVIQQIRKVKESRT